MRIVIFHHFRLIIVCDKSVLSLSQHRSARMVQPIYEFTKRIVSIFITRAEQIKALKEL